jgi:hypothetical protein
MIKIQRHADESQDEKKNSQWYNHCQTFCRLFSWEDAIAPYALPKFSRCILQGNNKMIRPPVEWKKS